MEGDKNFGNILFLFLGVRVFDWKFEELSLVVFLVLSFELRMPFGCLFKQIPPLRLG